MLTCNYTFPVACKKLPLSSVNTKLDHLYTTIIHAYSNMFWRAHKWSLARWY